jgi:hypothetical protein
LRLKDRNVLCGKFEEIFSRGGAATQRFTASRNKIGDVASLRSA